MADSEVIQLGKVQMQLKGDYNATVTYTKLDIVSYNGSSYICKVDECINHLPTDKMYWQIVGYSPIKGKDYFTSEEIEEIQNNILNSEIIKNCKEKITALEKENAEQQEELEMLKADYKEGKEEGEIVVITEGLPKSNVEVEIEGNNYQEQTEGYNKIDIENPVRLTNVNIGEKTRNSVILETVDYTSASMLMYEVDLKAGVIYSITVLTELLQGSLPSVDSTGRVELFQESTWLKAIASLNRDTFTTKGTFTVDEDGMYRIRYLLTSTGLLSASLKVKIKDFLLYEETTEKTFEPFTNGESTPNPNYKQLVEEITEASLVQRGKNRVNWANAKTTGAQYTFENDVLTVTNTSNNYPRLEYDVLNFIKNNPGKTLYFNLENYDFGTSPNGRVQLNVTDNGKTTYSGLLEKTGKKYSYPIPKDTSTITKAVLCIYVNNGADEGSYSIKLTKPILSFEENDTYEPYIEPIIKTIDLQGNSISRVSLIKDLLKIGVNGSVNLCKHTTKMLLNGTEDLVLNESTVIPNPKYHRFTIQYPQAELNNVNVNIISDSLKGKTAGTMWNNDIEGIAQSPTQIIIRTDKASTATELKAYLQNNPITCYPALSSENYETIELPSIKPIKLFKVTNIFELETNLGTTMLMTYKISNKSLEKRITALENAVIGG